MSHNILHNSSLNSRPSLFIVYMHVNGKQVERKLTYFCISHIRIYIIIFLFHIQMLMSARQTMVGVVISAAIQMEVSSACVERATHSLWMAPHASVMIHLQYIRSSIY